MFGLAGLTQAGGLGGISGQGGTAGPATNSGMNISGGVGSLTSLQQLMAISQGSSANGGVQWSNQAVQPLTMANPRKASDTTTYILLGVGGLVVLLLLLK